MHVVFSATPFETVVGFIRFHDAQQAFQRKQMKSTTATKDIAENTKNVYEAGEQAASLTRQTTINRGTAARISPHITTCEPSLNRLIPHNHVLHPNDPRVRSGRTEDLPSHDRVCGVVSQHHRGTETRARSTRTTLLRRSTVTVTTVMRQPGGGRRRRERVVEERENESNGVS